MAGVLKIEDAPMRIVHAGVEDLSMGNGASGDEGWVAMSLAVAGR
jgi:hypothetical protein